MLQGVCAAGGEDRDRHAPGGAEHHGAEDCHQPQAVLQLRGCCDTHPGTISGPGDGVHERETAVKAGRGDVPAVAPPRGAFQLPHTAWQHAGTPHVLRHPGPPAVHGGHPHQVPLLRGTPPTSAGAAGAGQQRGSQPGSAAAVGASGHGGGPLPGPARHCHRHQQQENIRAGLRLAAAHALSSDHSGAGGVGGCAGGDYGGAQVHGRVRAQQDPAPHLRLLLSKRHPAVPGGIQGAGDIRVTCAGVHSS
mmetsp:Transcript_14457/g.43725  ORF Transcript_14457/g.43725 Transcript_14457/m.43725 type:complete len:249 (+) Transcript_14457:1891-2637(+)